MTINKNKLQDNQPKLAIVLAYYKGSKYIKEQIESIFKQSFLNFELYIANDFKEEKIDLSKYNLNNEDLSKIKIIERKKSLGCIKNFLITLGEIKDSYDYYAMSDQDDIWFENKIFNAIETLEKYTKSTPNLYGARTEIFNEDCIKKIGTSKLVMKPLCFQNALVENFAGGNTMVFNSKAKDLIVNTSKDLEVAHHDWWSYLIVSGVGGNVIYDKRPSLKYRQHGINLTGSNRGIKNKFSRLKKFKQGIFRNWNEINIKALLINQKLLKKENQKTLLLFNKSRNANFIIRIFFFFQSKVYRQSFLENIVMFFGIIFKLV